MPLRYTRSRRRRVRRLLVLLGVLVLIVAGGVAAHYVTPLRAAATAREDVTIGVARERPRMASDMNGARAVLAGPFGQPTATDLVVSCTLSGGDAWRPGSFQQTCQLTSRAFYPVEGTARDVSSRLDPQHAVFPAGGSDFGRPCPVLRRDKLSQLEKLVVLHPAGRDCGAAPAPGSATRVLEPAGPGDIDPRRQWLEVILTRDVSGTDLGCAFPPLPRCTNPLAEPVLP